MKHLPVAAAVAALASSAVLVGVAGPAHAEERSCRGSLGAITVDNLRVPQGATCTLDGTRVEGTVTVQRGATLSAARIDVEGNVQAEDHRRVVLKRSTVDGSVQVVQGGSAVLARNRVGSDVQSFENVGAQRFTDNSVDGNLQCKENDPRPTGSGNRVAGEKEDQCAGL